MRREKESADADNELSRGQAVSGNALVCWFRCHSCISGVRPLFRAKMWQTIVLIFVTTFITTFRPLYAPPFFRWLECRTSPFISITFKLIADEQRKDATLDKLIGTSLQLKEHPVPFGTKQYYMMSKLVTQDLIYHHH